MAALYKLLLISGDIISIISADEQYPAIKIYELNTTIFKTVIIENKIYFIACTKFLGTPDRGTQMPNSESKKQPMFLVCTVE